MSASHTHACARCRRTGKAPYYVPAVTCPECRETMTSMGPRWRPPPRANRKAWAAVAQGRPLWDPKARMTQWKRNAPWRGIYRMRPPHMAGRL